MDLDVEELFGRRESVEREVGNSYDDEDGQGSDEEGSEGEQQQFGADEAVEVPENQEPEKKVVAPKRKVVKNPIPKLDIPRLVGPRGIGILESIFRDVKFQGKGHEYDDLTVLLKRLQHWAHRLFPKLPFDDSLKQMEKLGSKKQLQTHLKRIRLDMFVTPEEKPENEEEEEDNVLRGNEPEEDVFDELLRQNAQNMAQTTAATATSGQSLTEDQRTRLEQSRARAEELRRARRQQAEVAAHRELEEELFGPRQQKEDEEHEELFKLQEELEEEWQVRSQGSQEVAAGKRKSSEAQEKDEEEDSLRRRVEKRLRRISSSSEEENDQPQTFSEARISSQAIVNGETRPQYAASEESGPPQTIIEEGEPSRTVSEGNGLLQTVTKAIGSPQTVTGEEMPSQTTPAKESKTPEPFSVVSRSPQTTGSEESEPPHFVSEGSALPLPEAHQQERAVCGDWPLDKEEEEKGKEGAVGSVAKGEDPGQREGGEGQEMVKDGMPLCSEEEMMAFIND